MKASNFSDARKAFILKQAEEGVPVGDVCREVGISQATFYVWRKKYAGLLPSGMQRLKALEDENTRLKKLVAELSLGREMASHGKPPLMGWASPAPDSAMCDVEG